MKIAAQIKLALLTGVGAVLGLGLFDYYQSRQLAQQLQQLHQFTVAETEAISRIRESLAGLNDALTRLSDSPAPWPREKRTGDAALASLRLGFERLQEIDAQATRATAAPDPAGPAVSAEVRRALAEFDLNWSEYHRRLTAGLLPEAGSLRLTRLLPALAENLRPVLDRYISHLRLRHNEQVNRLTLQTHRALLLKLLGGGVLLTLAGLLLFLLQRGVLTPLRQLETEAAQVARGKGHFRLEAARADEVGSVARALNGLLDTLQANTLSKVQLEAALRAQASELERKGERLVLALDAARTSIWDYDIPSGLMTLDAGWSLMLGGAPEPVTSSARKAFARVHPEDRAPALQSVQACFEGRSDHYNAEYRVRNLQHGWTWVHSKGRVTARDPHGKPVHITGTNTDITPRKTAELALARQVKFLNALNQTTLALLQHRSKTEILEALTGQAATLLESVQVEVALVEGDALVTHAHGGSCHLHAGNRATRSEALLSWQAVDTRQPVIVDDLRAATGSAPAYPGTDYRSVAMFPILLGTRCLGVLGFLRNTPDQTFTTEERDKGLLLAQLAALVLHNADIFEEAVRIAEIRTSALRESEQLYRSLIESVTQGYYIADRRSLFTYCNPAMHAMGGFTPGELLGRSSFRLVADEDRPRVMESYRQWRTDPTVTHATDEFRVVAKHGRKFWVEQSSDFVRDKAGRVIEARNMLRDITERKEAEAARLQSEARFKGVFHESPIPIVLLSYPDGRVTEVNPATTEVFGYTREELLGRTTLELDVWPDLRDRAHFLAELQAGRSIRAAAATMRGKSGALIHIIYNASRISIDGQSCLLSSLIDITAQKQAEAALRQSEAQLRQAQKMESLGTLAGGIAHDFNNILTGILGHAQLAQGDLSPTHPAHQWMGGILKSGARAKNLVQQILTFSRKTGSTRSPVRLQGVTLESLGLLRATLPAMVRLQPVLADTTEIHQVILNLCTNAWHALPENGGVIEVGLHLHQLSPAAAADLPPLQPGPHVLLSVRDNGRGMDPALLDRIFEPFFTTKLAGKGTGLGLAVAHSIVAAHAGAITVRSTPGQGTIFEVYLPALAATEASPGPILPVATPVRGRGEHLLVVDDEPASGTVITRLLDRLGYRVTYCADPHAALARLAARDCALLISDLAMPGMSGDELARRALAQQPGLPVLLLSGFFEPSKMESFRTLGVREMLAKPPDYAELAAAVDRCLHG